MKKQFLWLALGVSALTACTSTDVVEEGPQSNVIGFENVVNKPVRSVVDGDLNNVNFDKFVVYGYYTKDGMEGHPIQVFDGVDVNKTDDGWTYVGTRYWNVSSTYYFYAYSCADITLAETYGTPSMNLAGNEQKERALRIEKYICNKNHQHDLICDAAENIPAKNENNSKVKFSFQHALCKVSAQFVNDFPGMYDIYISNVKLVNFYDQADLLIYDNNLEWSESHRTETLPSIDMSIDGSDKATSTQKYGEAAATVNINPVFMLPVAYTNDNVRFEFLLTVKQGEDIFLERTIKGTFKPDWQTGKQYKYNIHITGSTAQLEEIQFEGTHEVSDITDTQGWSGEITTDMSFSM